MRSPYRVIWCPIALNVANCLLSPAWSLLISQFLLLGCPISDGVIKKPNNTPKMVILSLTICVQQQKLLGVSSQAKKRDMDGKIMNQWETENKRLRGWCCCFWVDPLKFRTKSRPFGSNRISKRVVFLISLGASLMKVWSKETVLDPGYFPIFRV